MIKKKGIALFSTLLIMVLVIMLMSVALKNTTNIKKSQQKDRYLIQENITINDIKKLLKEKVLERLNNLNGEKKIQLQKVLFSSPLTIINKFDNTTITITLRPEDGKININKIDNADFKEYMKDILWKIGIKEVEIFRDVVMANIKTDSDQRDQYKLTQYNEDYNNGDITNYQDFKKIVDIYVMQSEDFNARKINYRKYFKFVKDVRGENLDFNYMDLILRKYIVPLNSKNKKLITKSSYRFTNIKDFKLEDEQKIEKVKSNFKTYNIKFETINTICIINIKSINYRVQYSFNYDIKNGKITNIEMDR